MEETRKGTVEAYVSGAYWGDKGGYAVTMLFKRGDKKHMKRYLCSNSFADTTNSRMTIRGILYILKNTKPDYNICICTDDEYCLNTVNEWLAKWEFFGNIRSKKNWDLWHPVWEEILKRTAYPPTARVYAKLVSAKEDKTMEMTQQKAFESRSSQDTIVCKERTGRY